MIFSNKFGICCLLLVVQQCAAYTRNNETAEENNRTKKVLSIFNVVTFPNTPCGGTSGYNGTCYTASECISKGGTASGNCASSFGVCCIFSLSCGGTTSENNTYAIISSYSISSDKDPCSYSVCKLNSDVCKLRIDFDTMVLEGPYATVTAAADGPKVGDCIYDTLTVTNPGGPSPPVICGYNTGQHMFIPASSSCNTINIDIDTGTTTTTRKWQIKVTQFQCGNQMAPEQDCLQYFTAQKGTIATFNWDTSATTVSTTQIHLSSQYYDICIRRQKTYCSMCLSPQISPASTAKVASSYGLGSSSDGTNSKSAAGSTCTGLTTQPADTGYGDYIEIANLQPSIGTAGTISTSNRLCGAIFDANAIASTAQATACSFATPFKIGVHFDEGESLVDTKAATPDLNKGENVVDLETNEGYGYSGFYMAYWMNSC